jgi:hypothetical protein
MFGKKTKKWLCELLVIQRKCGEQFLVLDDKLNLKEEPIRKLFGNLARCMLWNQDHDYSSC